MPERPRRAFRFGVQATADSSAQWQNLARKLEDLGYSTLVVADHFDRQLSPFAALMSAGAVTTRLRLGTLVLNNDMRHPAAMAKEAATVDVLTQGRLELGLGAGWVAADYLKTGIPFAAPGERLARLVESVEIVNAFFTQDTVTFHGKHYHVDGLDAFPSPLQKPRPPLVIGGRQRTMLRFAARQADIISISMVQPRGAHPQAPAASISEKVEWIRSAAGARLPDIELSVNCWNTEITDDPRAALERMASRLRLPEQDLRQAPGTLVGSVEAVAERLLAWRETHGLSYFVVLPAAVDTFAAVVARLAGQ